MKFVLNVVTRGINSRRRRGKAKDIVIDTAVQAEYDGLTNVLDVEHTYLALTNAHLQGEFVVVVDARPGR